MKIPNSQITPDVWYVGVNDRVSGIFERMWPLPYGVSYNSYLITDEQVTLLDTVESAFFELFLKQIKGILGERPIDYLIINHMEPDHSGSIGMLCREYPQMKLVGNKKTFNMLAGYYPELSNERVVVDDGHTLSIGQRTLQFITAPMVHWPEVMFTYSAYDKILFSADAFGTFGTLDGNIFDRDCCPDHYFEEMYRYYACIVGKFGPFVQKVLAKVLAMNIPIDYVCSLHGPIWTAAHFPKALGIYDQLSKYESQKGAVILYGSMYGNTAVPADIIARSLAAEGIKHIVCYDLSTSNPSFVLRDVFRYRAVIVGAPTYCMDIFPPVKEMMEKFAMRDIKDRLLGVFGSYSFAGQATKKLTAYADTLKWELVGTPLDQLGATGEDDAQKAIHLGRAVAKRLHELYPEE